MHTCPMFDWEAAWHAALYGPDGFFARGEKPDVYVQNGDVIEIGATPPKLVAYGLFYFFTAVFHIGAGLSVI